MPRDYQVPAELYTDASGLRMLNNPMDKCAFVSAGDQGGFKTHLVGVDPAWRDEAKELRQALVMAAQLFDVVGSKPEANQLRLRLAESEARIK